ncbi:hypothetical protein LAJ19_20265 (plasmid) [Deinococcus taeanensis]|uniref:hypothetical protein n=1 Tax=Deinococcus taeanensis TaxID=2737050 RepID=UPI001CDB6A93|nr:hypothetical protein [Deinococcus taeanensis]UBV45462.1 hypothetical protein LAJ19_20265 [Deinococcus taeanensis]
MPETPVEVYRNLTRRCWSVRQGGRVIAHSPWLLLRDVTMIVRPGGRDRVRRTGRNEVHAWVRGTPAQHPPPAGLERARDNPVDTVDDVPVAFV